MPELLRGCVIEELGRILIELVQQRAPGSCMKVDCLPRKECQELCLAVREHAEKARGGVETFVVGDGVEEPMIRIDRAVELRDEVTRSGRARLLLFVPAGFSDPIAGSIKNPFEPLDADSLVAEALKRALGRIVAEPVRELARAALREARKLKRWQAQQADFVASVASVANPRELGLNLWRIGLVPDLAPTPERLDLNRRKVDHLEKQGRRGETLEERIGALELQDPVVEQKLSAFLHDNPPAANTDWCKAIAEKEPSLTFDNWRFTEHKGHGLVRIEIEPFRKEGGAVRPGIGLRDENGALIASPERPVKVHFVTEPEEVEGVGGFRLLAVNALGAEDDPGDLPEVEVSSRRHSGSLSFEGLDLGENQQRLVKIKVVALDDAGNPLLNPEGNPIEAVSDDELSVSSETALSPEREPSAPRVTSIAQARMRVLLASARLDAGEVLIVSKEEVPGPPGGSPSNPVRFTVSGKLFRIEVPDLLAKLEWDSLNSPEYPGPWLVKVTGGIGRGTHAPMQGSVIPEDSATFRTAREKLFRTLRENGGLVETAKLHEEMFARLAKDYLESYQNWLERPSTATFDPMELDTAAIHDASPSENRPPDVLLVLPTHPMMVAWQVQFAGWTQRATEILGPLGSTRERRNQLDEKIVASLEPRLVPPFVTYNRQLYMASGCLYRHWPVMVRVGASPADAFAALRRLFPGQVGVDAVESLDVGVIAREIRRYQMLHPYLAQLRLGVVEPGDGEAIARAVGTIAREEAKRREEHPTDTDDQEVGVSGPTPRRFDLTLWSNDVAGCAQAIRSCVEDVRANRLQDETIGALLSPGPHRLAPTLALRRRSRAGLDPVEADRADQDFHMIVLAAGADVKPTSIPDKGISRPSSPLGLQLDWVSPQGGEPGEPVPRAFCPADPARGRSPYLPEKREDLSRALVGGARNMARRAFCTIGVRMDTTEGGDEFEDEQEAPLTTDAESDGDVAAPLDLLPAVIPTHGGVGKEDRWAHEHADWVVTVGLSCPVETYDQASHPGMERLLLYYEPEFGGSFGRRVAVTTRWASEVVSLLDRLLKHMRVVPSPEGGEARRVLDFLRSLSARLVLKLFGDERRAMEVVGLALAHQVLVGPEGHEIAKGVFVIPADSHMALLRSPAETVADSPAALRTDLILVRPTELELQVSCVEVKYRASFDPDSPAAEALATEMHEKNVCTFQNLNDRFFDQERFDLPFQRAALERLLAYYLDRAVRHDLFRGRADVARRHLARLRNPEYPLAPFDERSFGVVVSPDLAMDGERRYGELRCLLIGGKGLKTRMGLLNGGKSAGQPPSSVPATLQPDSPALESRQTPAVSEPVVQSEPTPQPLRTDGTGTAGPCEASATPAVHGPAGDEAPPQAAAVAPPSVSAFVTEKRAAMEKLFRASRLRCPVVDVLEGPSTLCFRVRPPEGKVRKVLGLGTELHVALAPKDNKEPMMRVEAGAIGIYLERPQRSEVPLLELCDLLDQDSFGPATIPLGRDISNNLVSLDFSDSDSAHVLLGGQTGSGKSVALEALIAAIIRRNTPDTAGLRLIDPKMVEFAAFKDAAHVREIATEASRAMVILRELVKEMESRYRRFAQAQVKTIDEFRKAPRGGPLAREFLVFDEFADVILQRHHRDDVEDAIVRLAQKGRAAGVHLIVATQRPSADVVTPLLRANLTAKIALKVDSMKNSEIVLGSEDGRADLLFGRGDMLLLKGGVLTRLQGARIQPSALAGLLKGSHCRT